MFYMVMQWVKCGKSFDAGKREYIIKPTSTWAIINIGVFMNYIFLVITNTNSQIYKVFTWTDENYWRFFFVI